MIGYGIFLGCAMLLGGICLSTRKQIHVYEAKSMIYGGGGTGNLTLTFSILAAWMWTTSVFGSAETYALYGIWDRSAMCLEPVSLSRASSLCSYF